MKPVSNHCRLSKMSHLLGQGMTEYIIIVALVAVAAIGAFKMFGQTAQYQIAGLATELSGQDAEDMIENAQSAAEESAAQAAESRALGSFNGGNDAGI